MTVLVTGGTGFIGSHQVAALAEAGESFVIVDDGSNSDHSHVLDHLTELTGHRPVSHRFNIRDTARLAAVIRRHSVDEVIHFAAMKDLRESVARPTAYYQNNLEGLTSVIEASDTAGVRKLVFSSSGSVYGDADQLPILEDAPHRPTNPYSMTKSIGERMLSDLCESDPSWSILALRYFNPAGAHPSTLIGESPTRRRTNLLPMLLDVAAGHQPSVDVFGDDFDTPDGTGVRDYVHVTDVAEAHVAGLRATRASSGFQALNIGRGEGVSVRQLVSAVETVTGRSVPMRMRERRPGDVAALVGSTDRANRCLRLKPPKDLLTIAADAWRWRLETDKPSSCWAKTSQPCRTAS